MPAPAQDIHQQLAAARLPSLPHALLQIMELAERDDVGLAELAQVAARDAALAAKILASANSAYYSRGRPVSSLEQCLTVLGAAQVRRIALNQSVAELFGQFKPNAGFDMRPYWHHVLHVAILARELAPPLHYPHADEAYLAGLLHNVGQLALLAVAPQRYLALAAEAGDERQLLALERQAFGLDHAEVGAWLAQQWQMHAFFADALRYHHQPLERLQDAHPLTQLVGLANHLDSQEEAPADDAMLAAWGLDRAAVQAHLASATNEARGIAEALGLEFLPRSALPRPAQAAPDALHDRLADAVSARIEAHTAAAEPLSAADLHTICQGVLRSARILFGRRQAGLFLLQDDALQGHADDDSRLNECRIRLPAPDSHLARALSGPPQLAGDATAHLGDAQVMRILGQPHMLCLALRHDGAALGVLAMGLDAAAAQAFMARTALLATFAREAGQRLGTALAQLRALQEVRSANLADYRLHARKIVHEANNPLGVVRNYLALLREQLTDTGLTDAAQAREDMDLMAGELRRVARILQDLRQMEPPPPRAQAHAGIDVNALIREVARSCRLGRADMARVNLRLELEDPLPGVRTQGDKLKQVLTNLIFNAAEAMPDGGTLTITTAAWQAAAGQRSVEIGVADTGPGLPPAVLARLHQPKASAKGGSHQGLGLAIVGQLMAELGGGLHCQSSSAGTRFKLQFPALPASQERHAHT